MQGESFRSEGFRIAVYSPQLELFSEEVAPDNSGAAGVILSGSQGFRLVVGIVIL